MVESNKLKDGLVFVNESNPRETIIVNFYSWVNIVKGVMVFYGGVEEQEAESLINNLSIFTTPPENYFDACLLGHEDEYYWAMVMSHGDRYFEKGFSRTLPDDYFEWEDKYIIDHKLQSRTLIFND